jgi:hypothetical protein
LSFASEKSRLLAAAFQMPSVQTMVSRKSSVTNAFVNSLIPVIAPSIDEIAEALRILEMTVDDVRCAYCGDRSTEWDHLRPLVLNLRPTGYISEIGNLAPACGKCNQSKGNKQWHVWMRSGAKRSPAQRNIPDLERRIAHLEAYERWKDIKPIDFEKIVDAALWHGYWKEYEQLIEAMKASQRLADALKAQIRQGHDRIVAGTKVV